MRNIKIKATAKYTAIEGQREGAIVVTGEDAEALELQYLYSEPEDGIGNPAIDLTLSYEASPRVLKDTFALDDDNKLSDREKDLFWTCLNPVISAILNLEQRLRRATCPKSDVQGDYTHLEAIPDTKYAKIFGEKKGGTYGG